jgi:hypothetical protein
MKKKYFFILLFWACKASAQTESFYTQPFYSSEIIKAVQTKDKNTWYIGRSSGIGNAGWGRTVLFIGVLDSLLRPIKTFTKNLPHSERMQDVIFKPLEDSTFLVGFNSNLCDLFSNNAILGVYDIQDESYFPIFENNSGITNIFPMPNGAPAAYSSKGKNLLWYNTEQMVEELAPIPLVNNETVDIIFTSDERIYYRTDKGVFYSVDFLGKNKKTLGAFSNKLGIFEGIILWDEIEKDKKIIFASYKTLYYIDFQANIKKEYSLTTGKFSALRFFKDIKKIYLGRSSGELTTFDENFNILNEIPFVLKNINKPTDFFQFNNKVYFTGATNFTPFSLLQAPYYEEIRNTATIQPVDSISFKTNVAINNVQFENPIPIQSTTNLGNQVHYNFDFGNTTVTIQNTGKDTIQNINIAFNHKQFSYICNTEVSQMWRKENLNLSPNKKMIISLGSVILNEQKNDKPDNIVFNVSLVNDKPNGNLTNGFFQADYNTVRLSEVKYVNNVQITPNPASQLVYINSPEENIQQVEIFDLSGKKILSQNIDNQLFINIDIDRLVAGFYQLLIKKEKSVTVAKLVVEGKR